MHETFELTPQPYFSLTLPHLYPQRIVLSIYLSLSSSGIFIIPKAPAVYPSMASQDRGKPLPKFGEWDVNNPASADGFTVIFAKARDDKKTHGSAAAGGPPFQQKRNDNPPKQEQNYQQPPMGKKWFCCF